jgi:hypothetical protein
MSTSMSLEQLLALEHEGWRALCEGRGSRFYGDLMTPDGLMVLGHGMVLGRAQVVESLDHAPPWDRYEISAPRLVEVDERAAALVYRATAVRKGAEPFTALMSSVYRRVGGRDRLTLYQQTTAH